jgi:hypothetical protein
MFHATVEFYVFFQKYAESLCAARIMPMNLWIALASSHRNSRGINWTTFVHLITWVVDFVHKSFGQSKVIYESTFACIFWSWLFVTASPLLGFQAILCWQWPSFTQYCGDYIRRNFPCAWNTCANTIALLTEMVRNRWRLETRVNNARYCVYGI